MRSSRDSLPRWADHQALTRRPTLGALLSPPQTSPTMLINQVRTRIRAGSVPKGLINDGFAPAVGWGRGGQSRSGSGCTAMNTDHGPTSRVPRAGGEFLHQLIQPGGQLRVPLLVQTQAQPRHVQVLVAQGRGRLQERLDHRPARVRVLHRPGLPGRPVRHAAGATRFPFCAGIASRNPVPVSVRTWCRTLAGSRPSRAAICALVSGSSRHIAQDPASAATTPAPWPRVGRRPALSGLSLRPPRSDPNGLPNQVIDFSQSLAHHRTWQTEEAEHRNRLGGAATGSSLARPPRRPGLPAALGRRHDQPVRHPGRHDRAAPAGGDGAARRRVPDGPAGRLRDARLPAGRSPAGAWVDRMRKRTVLIAGDLRPRHRAC